MFSKPVLEFISIAAAALALGLTTTTRSAVADPLVSPTTPTPSGAVATPVEVWLADKAPRYQATHPPLAWKFAHPAPPASTLPPLWQSGFDWLHTVTDGAITIKQYGGGTLYGVAGGFNAIRAGVADYGTCYTLAEAQGFELLKTLQTPFVAPANPWLRARIVNELAASTFKQEFLRRGVYIGHILPSASLKLLSKTPVRTPADLRGKKVFSLMNAPGAAAALGYTDVQLPFPEIYTALQYGVIDAVIWLDMGIIPFKIYEQAKFYTDLNIATTTVETCFNRNSFDQLPAGLKPVVYELQQRIMLDFVKRSEAFAVTAKTTLRDHGVDIISVPTDAQIAWQQAFAPVTEQWLAQCDEAGKDCRGVIKEVQRLTTKYGDLSDTALMELNVRDPVPGIIDF